MKSRRFLAVAFVWVLLGGQALSASSYYYESITTTTMGGGKEQRDMTRGWVDGTNVRLEFPQGGHGGKVQQGTYMLTNNAGETIYMVDPKEKVYFEIDVSQLMSLIEATGGMVQLEFSDVSAEKLSESAGGPVLGHSTTKYKLRTGFTMEMSVMGMQRVSTVDATQDLWITRDVGGEAWTMWLKMMPSGGDTDQFLQWAEQSGLTNGFPLRSSSLTTMTNRKGKTQTTQADMEVTVLRQEPIDVAMFQIPPDYTKSEVIPPELGGQEGEAEGPLKSLKGMFGRKKKKDGG